MLTAVRTNKTYHIRGSLTYARTAQSTLECACYTTTNEKADGTMLRAYSAYRHSGGNCMIE